METSREPETHWLPACKTRRLMVVWRYENGRENRWEDWQGRISNIRRIYSV